MGLEVGEEVGKAVGTAVGNAVGANPVALWIPCHRVIQQSGALGGYRWGLDVKRKVQAWEAAQYAEQLESAHG